MPGVSDRTRYWRELRSALVNAKRSETSDRRDALLNEVGRWAEKLAETADADGPEPGSSSYYIDVAMEDTDLVKWTIPL